MVVPQTPPHDGETPTVSKHQSAKVAQVRADGWRPGRLPIGASRSGGSGGFMEPREVLWLCRAAALVEVSASRTRAEERDVSKGCVGDEIDAGRRPTSSSSAIQPPAQPQPEAKADARAGAVPGDGKRGCVIDMYPRVLSQFCGLRGISGVRSGYRRTRSQIVPMLRRFRGWRAFGHVGRR